MEENFKVRASSDGLDLHATLFRPEGEPRGVILAVHGMCEHRKHYYPFLEWMASKGYAAVCYDHRGHGESIKEPGDLGYMYDGGWRALVDDCGVLVDWIGANFPGVPVWLFGHSMGSMVVRSYTKRHDDRLSGLIVCGCPSKNPLAKIGVVLAALIGFFAGWRSHSAFLRSMSTGKFEKVFASEGEKRAWICSDLAVAHETGEDPLCGFTFTNNGNMNLSALMVDCYSPKGWKMSNPDLPILFISGADDPCRLSDKAFEEAVDFMRSRGYRSVTSRLYSGVRHHILLDRKYKEVYEDVLKFVEIKK